jgi:uncharacterized membrane protein
MRKYLSLAAIAALAIAGCNNSPEGGTPGTHSTFTVSAPTTSTTIKQDNKETVKLSLSRGSDFKKAVKLSVSAPDRIEAKLNKDTIAPSDPTDFTVTISVAKDAPLGDQTIKVTATPEGGGSATNVEFKVKVEKNP